MSLAATASVEALDVMHTMSRVCRVSRKGVVSSLENRTFTGWQWMTRGICNTSEAFRDVILPFVRAVRLTGLLFLRKGFGNSCVKSPPSAGPAPHSSSSPYLLELEFLFSICLNVKCAAAGSSSTPRL